MRVSAVLLGAVLLAGPAVALGPLKEVSAVREGLIATGMAIRIAERCDSIDARIVRGVSYLNSLRQYARDLGYSNEQIDAYIADEAEEQQLIVEAESRLAAKGAVEGQPDTFCTVGRAEIAAGSATGRLLR